MSSTEVLGARRPVVLRRAPSPWLAPWRFVRRYPLFPAIIWGAVIVFAIASPLIAPADPFRQVLTDRLQPPAWSEGGSMKHVLGTDHLGRDVFSRIVYGSRVTVTVVLLTVTASAATGTFVGMLAGYFGGTVDALLMRAVDFQIALPALLFGVMLSSVLEPGLRNVVVIIVLFTWASFARLVRAEVLSLRERDYVLLARAAGAGWVRIFVKHLFPGVLNTVMVLATLEVSVVIIFESSLSFLGLGIVPPTVSWGAMLAEGREYMSVAWWLVTIPGLAIFSVALAGNLFGDWLRDTLDPHLRRSA
ncbi:MAG: ABC transporter permease [Chloroflexi bacterium]|nr:ABC transporter permease [Chloroflexota bacterium]